MNIYFNRSLCQAPLAVSDSASDDNERHVAASGQAQHSIFHGRFWFDRASWPACICPEPSQIDQHVSFQKFLG